MCQDFVIKRRIFLAFSSPFIEMLEFNFQDCSLDGIQPEVPADHTVMILRLAPVYAQHAQLFSQLIIAGNHHPAIAETPEVFAGEKGETTHQTHGSSALTSVFGANGLGGILDYGD